MTKLELLKYSINVEIGYIGENVLTNESRYTKEGNLQTERI